MVVQHVHVTAHCNRLPHCVLPAELHKRGAQVYFGDLVCKWWPWMHNVADKVAALQQECPERLASLNLPAHLLLTREQLDKMTPATPAMHACTHVWHCQAEYGPNHQTGVGNEAGETTELVNAYLSSLAPSVRHMSHGSELVWVVCVVDSKAVRAVWNK
jgi:hypothetical protein